MPVYLDDIPLEEAQTRFAEALSKSGLGGLIGTEEIQLDENALGRVLAETVWAALSSPHYHASAMDGFAVRAEDTLGAQPSQPIVLKAGSQALYLDTGDPIPDWANAVIPIENCEPVGASPTASANPRLPDAIRIRAAVAPWAHVRPLGEDIVATQLVLPAGQTIRPVDIGALAACGQRRLNVSRKPRVGILPTGTELIPTGQIPKSGEIIEFNSIVLAAQVKEWGGEPVRYPICPDDFNQIRDHLIQAALDCDLVLINAGSSAGSEDFTAQAIQALGEVFVHGVAVRPGHPVILGMLQLPEKPTPVIGVPGYPVSAALTGEIFVEPLLARWLGKEAEHPVEVEAEITRKVTSPAGDEDYLRVALGRVGDRLLAAPLPRGAGTITSLVRADGITVIPSGVQGLEGGARVKVRLYRPLQDIERTLFSIGSHDMTLDLLAQFLSRKGKRLVSVNAGSLGGLVALRRGEAHFAGSHLLDVQTNTYNRTYIQDYLGEIPVRILGWVGRQQGLLVPPGNPVSIQSLADLSRPGIQIVNRQRGSGTRVLLDYHLQQNGIQPSSILGYEQEEYTHLAVAAAVASGRASCGLGIAAAAQALNLDFVPLFMETYELIIPSVYVEQGWLYELLQVARDSEFQETVSQLPGYDVRPMGIWQDL